MTDLITLRTAVPEERTALEELQRRASLVWEDTRDALLANPDAIELPEEQVQAGQIRVAEVDGKIAGFSAVLPIDPHRRELDGLFVEPQWWRRGVGRLLIDDAVARAAASGARCLEVTANPNALDFYERVGFTGTEEVATRFGPGLRMRLDFGRTAPVTG